MRLLILGGTQFLGRAVARHAHDAGHDVTCAARGLSGDPVPGVRFVPVDRDHPDGLAGLTGHEFDAVVDVTRRPSHARSAVTALADRIAHWSYVSSISAYADERTPDQRAGTAPLKEPAPAGADDSGGQDAQWYGRCKVACEEVVRDAVGPQRAFVCRAGLIVGPEDPSDRFPYWVARFARSGGASPQQPGEVLAPGSPADPVQFVDVADLAGWLVRAAETGLHGDFNGVGTPMRRDRFLTEVAAGVGVARPRLTWVDQEFLQSRDVRPWSGPRSLPLWLPLPEYAGFLTHDATAALAAGLVTRPLAETAATTLRWLTDHPGDVRAGGLDLTEETKVLREWHARPAGGA